MISLGIKMYRIAENKKVSARRKLASNFDLNGNPDSDMIYQNVQGSSGDTKFNKTVITAKV